MSTIKERREKLKARFNAALEAKSRGLCWGCSRTGTLCLDCQKCFAVCHPFVDCTEMIHPELSRESPLILLSYPLPEANPACQCKGNPMRAMFCPFGHMTECHAPSPCTEARCTHLLKYDEGDINRADLQIVDAGTWAELNIRWFKDSPDAGEDCTCSYCGQPIFEPVDLESDGAQYIPLRFVFRFVDLAAIGILEANMRTNKPCPEDVDTYAPMADMLPADYLEIRFHEHCALRALPAVYAMNNSPMANEDTGKPN